MIFEDFVFGVSWFAAVERENLWVILVPYCHFKSGLVLPQVGKEGSDWRDYCVPSSSSFPWPGTKMWHCQVTKYLSVLRQTDFSPPHTHTHKNNTLD